MPRADLIASKTADIAHQIGVMRANVESWVRVGGRTVINLDNEVAFQQMRLDQLTWASSVTDAEIQTQINTYMGQMSTAAQNALYGVLTGLPMDQIELIAKVEVLQIALGTHPGVQS